MSVVLGTERELGGAAGVERKRMGCEEKKKEGEEEEGKKRFGGGESRGRLGSRV